MNRIITIDELQSLSLDLHKSKKKIVLVGGGFDIVHIGHITFLRNAKKEGDILITLLESDKALQKTKGKTRPINTQQDRAELLAEFISVDYIVLLPSIVTNETYDLIVNLLKPAIIATTKGDPYLYHKTRQANMNNATVKEVLLPVADQSTTRIAKLLSTEL